MDINKTIRIIAILLMIAVSCTGPEKVIRVFGRTSQDQILVQIPSSRKSIEFTSFDADKLSISLYDIRGFYDESDGALFLLESIDGFKTNGYYIVIIERSGTFKKA